jgi:hypothetical protein
MMMMMMMMMMMICFALAKTEPVTAVQSALCVQYHTEPPWYADFCGLLWKQSRTRSTVASETQASQDSWLCTYTLFARRLSLSWARLIHPCHPLPNPTCWRSSPLLGPYQTIGSSPRPCEMLHNTVIFYSECVNTSPTPKLEDHRGRLSATA